MSLRKLGRTSEGRELHPLARSYFQQAPSHIKLVKGVVRFNPHLQVLCPTLAKGYDCQRGKWKKGKQGRYRPKLLVKNYGDPNLQLWMCEGCRDKFLLRVDVNGTS